MKNILVTGANGDIGEAVGRILIEEFPNTRITGSDSNGKLPGAFTFPRMIKVPYASNLNYEKKIKNMMGLYDLIIPTSEPEIRKISSLNIKGWEKSFLILPSLLVEKFLDKYETFRFLQLNNFNPPDTKLLNEVKEQDLPIYIKPRFGAGGKGNRILNNRYDLLSCSSLNREMWVAQEILTGEDNEYTCAIFKSKSIMKTIQFKRELFGDRTGIAEVVNNKMVDRLLSKISKTLDFEGCLNVQLKVVNGQPKIFEINPRISSTVMMRNKIGFKDCIWWVKSRMNIPIEKNDNIKVGTKIFRMANEKIFVPK